MELKTDRKKLSVWLAKVPKYLGEKIMSLKKGQSVGALQIDSTDGTQNIGIRLSSAITETGIPSEYMIELKQKNGMMYLVRNGKKRYEVEGVVNKECFIRPVMNPEYLRFKREIKSREEGVDEKVKIIDYFSEVQRSAKYSTLREIEALARKRKQVLQDRKRERLDRDDVLELVFNAFEMHQFWTVKDLANFCGQPDGYIQEIFNDICLLNKRDHRNSYELKPEYKRNS